VEFRRGETVERELGLRDHREHRTEGDQRMGRAHVSDIAIRRRKSSAITTTGRDLNVFTAVRGCARSRESCIRPR